MIKNYQQTILQDALLKHHIFNGQFGIEKENARIDKNGHLALTPHPEVFGDKAKHPYITTDFSESQVEMITPPLPTIHEALGFLETLHDIVSNELEVEYLWPQSAPPILPQEEAIPIAQFGESDQQAERYRELLADIYGKKVQLISGVHFNFSFEDTWLQRFYALSDTDQDFEAFKNVLYLKISRNFIRYRWLLSWLFGKSPTVHKSYVKACVDRFPSVEPDAFSYMEGTSVRAGVCGYRNHQNFTLDYSSWKSYQNSIDTLVQEGKLMEHKELYTPIRLKSLVDDDISHLEVRTLDLNPLLKSGISSKTLHNLHLFLLYSLLKEEQDTFDERIQNLSYINHDLACTYGINQKVKLKTYTGEHTDALTWATEIVQEMEALLSPYLLNTPHYAEAFEHMKTLVAQPEKRASHIILEGVQQEGYIPYHLQKAHEYAEASRNKNFNFLGLEDMELSTQLLLREAVKRGIEFEILDRDENFIRLKKGDQVEYVQQATKTSLDTYSGVLSMENKLITKKILEEVNIRVPEGGYYTEQSKALIDFPLYQGTPIVIKPKSTNFGLGISILKENESEEQYQKAIEMAFQEDSSILIEEFISGKEYRIFLINHEVVGILHRVPANVKGDGQSSIRELVIEKNKDPLRGKGYRTPLEKIALGDAEALFLETQGLSFDDIPAKDEIVYLRENSNISTGGDSVDYTDDIPDSYKQIAVRAAQAMEVNITGLDMMIDNIHEEANEHNHAIIEMNFNPAIHIHCHPYIGKNRKLNEKILDALFA